MQYRADTAAENISVSFIERNERNVSPTVQSTLDEAEVVGTQCALVGYGLWMFHTRFIHMTHLEAAGKDSFGHNRLYRPVFRITGTIDQLNSFMFNWPISNMSN